MGGPVRYPTARFVPPVDPSGDSAHLVGRLLFRQFPPALVLSNGNLGNVEPGHSYDASVPNGDRTSVRFTANGEIPASDLSAVSERLERFLNDQGLVAPGFARTLSWRRLPNSDPKSPRQSYEVEIDPGRLDQSSLARGRVFQALSLGLEALWPATSALGAPPSYHFNWRTGDLWVSVSRLSGSTYAAHHLNGPTLDMSAEVSEADLKFMLRGGTKLSDNHSARSEIIKRTLRQANLLEDRQAGLSYAIDFVGNEGQAIVVAIRPSPGISIDTALNTVSVLYHAKHQYRAAQSIIPALQAFFEMQQPAQLIYLDDVRAPEVVIAVPDREALNPPQIKITVRLGEERPGIEKVFSDRHILTRQDLADPRVLWIEDLTQPAFGLLVSHAFQEAIRPFAVASE